jgi:hypothetical protein
MGAVAVWRVPASRWFCVGGHVVDDAGGEFGVATPPRAKQSHRVRQIRICKRQRPVRWWQEPLAPDARDPDIVRAK